MPETSASQPANQSAENLVQSVMTATDPVREILRFILEQVDRKDPALAELVRALAIPRRFNLEIVAAVRDEPAEDDKNQELLNGVLRFSFVRNHPDGGSVYEESYRRVLLETWNTSERQEQYRQIQQRLVDHYKAQHDLAKELEADLDYAGFLIKEANPSRFIQVATAVEKNSITPLLEILYHQINLSHADGYDFFSRTFEDYEARKRLRVSEVLLHNARENLQALPGVSGQELYLKWLQYYHARLYRDRRNDADAERILSDLLPQTYVDNKLRLWVLGDLADILHRQYRLREARQYYEEMVSLAESSRADVYNLPVWQSYMADLYWTMEELELGVAEYRKVIQSAEEAENKDMLVIARLNLSGVLQDLGRLDEALDAALEGLDYARSSYTSLSVYANIFNDAGRRLMRVFGQRRETRLVDSIFAEVQGSLLDLEDPRPGFELRNLYAGALYVSNQAARSAQELARLQADAQGADLVLQMDLLYTQALQADYLGRLEDAANAHSRLIDLAKQSSEGTWYLGTAHNARGQVRLEEGRWEEAESDLRSAESIWDASGHERLKGIVWVNLARLAMRQGRLPEAQSLLDRARGVLKDDTTTTLGDFYWSQAEVHQAKGAWDEALKTYQQALSIYGLSGQLKEVAELANAGSQAAARGAQWETAAQLTGKARECQQRIMTLDRYRPGRDVRWADKKNADAMRAFGSPAGDWKDNLELSVSQLREVIRRERDNVWYRLNLAHVYAALEWWQNAADELDGMLEWAPEWLRRPVLYRRLVDYLQRQGESLEDKGQYTEAVDHYSAARNRLQERVPFDLLRQVWLKLGDNLIRQGDWARAAREFSSGLALTRKARDPFSQSSFHVRLGFLAVMQSDVEGAREHFWQGIRLRIKTSGDGAIREIVNEISGLVVSGEQYHSFTIALRVLNRDARLTAAQKQELYQARMQFTRENYPLVARPLGTDSEIEADVFSPAVTPITIESDEALYPQGKDTPEVVRMLDAEDGDIIEMRRRIEARTGVRVPRVLLRSNLDLTEGRFILKFYDLAILRGQVLLGKKYCPNAAACATLGVNVIPPSDPQDPGVWLDEIGWREVEEAELPLWDVYRTTIFYTEVFLLFHLARFIGVQEASEMLDRWEQMGEEGQVERKVLRAQTVPDAAALVRLVQVLQGLVKEGAPVNHLEAILPAFQRARGHSTENSDLIEAVRLNLKDDLTGNNPGHRWIPLPADLEAEIARYVIRQDGKRFLAAPADEVTRLRNAVDALFGQDRSEAIALVVPSADLRPFVRRLLEDVYPNLPVLSEAEIKRKVSDPELRRQHARQMRAFRQAKTHFPGDEQEAALPGTTDEQSQQGQAT